MRILETLSVTIIDRWRYTFFTIGYMLVSILIILLLGVFLHNPYVAIGLPLLWILPALFQKQFRKRFLQNAVISFFDTAISVDLVNTSSGSHVQGGTYEYNELKSVKGSVSSKNDYGYLRLVFKNGSKTVYSLIDQSNEDENNINKVVVRHIEAYNGTREKDERVKL